MNKEQATKIAEDYVNKTANDCSLLYDQIIEFKYGFCFIWNSNTYIKTKKMDDMLVGPAAFIVPKDGGEIYCLGSAYSFESLIEEYTNCHEEQNGTYSLWVKGKLTNSTIIRERYNISMVELINAMKGISPLLKGSKSKLLEEQEFIAGLGSELELRET